MKTQILGIITGIVIGVPVIASGSSIVSSLIDGKTLEESMVILADQLDCLITLVSILETDQAQIVEEINALKTGQVQVGSNITETNLELEALQLENEILKTKAENDRIKEETEARTAAKIEECKRLIMVVPVGAGGTYNQVRIWGGGKSIVDLYEKVMWFLSNEEHSDTPDDMEMVRAAYAEVKPLYEAYVAQCE